MRVVPGTLPMPCPSSLPAAWPSASPSAWPSAWPGAWPAAVPGQALIEVDGPGALLRLAIVVIVCTGLAALIRVRAQIGNGRDEVIAAARATAQLSLVGLVITAVLGSWWLTTAFLALMVTVAALTLSARLRLGPRWWLFLPVCAGALPTVALLLAVGLLPTHPIAVIPVVGILIGNAMTAATLCGRRTLDALENRYGEVEAALSLGFMPRPAALEVARPDASLALVPGLDQTRTVGLVTLPGAFVGSLLGGATPLEAAALQLVVLVALLLVQSIATVTMLELIVRQAVQPAGHPERVR